MHSRWLIGLLPIFFWLVSAPAAASVEAAFKAARNHYQNGQMAQFERAAARIPRHHVLQPYLHFWRLDVDSASPDELLAFIDAHPDTPLAVRAREQLAGLYALAQNWPAFRTQFRALERPPQELVCHDLRLRHAEGDAQARQAAQALWLTGNVLPDSCAPLFAALFRQGELTPEHRYQRLRLALERNNLSLARALEAQLPAAERMDDDALTRAQQQPEALIRSVSPRRGQREAALYALSQIARQEPEQAARLWEAQDQHYPELERRHGWLLVATHAARRHHPRALEWFNRAGAANTLTQSELQAQWRARAALRAGQWDAVYHAILAMPDHLQEQPTWRYWRARALRALNAPAQANALFAQLSQQHDYYGLLALEALPPRLEARPAPLQLTPEDRRWAQQHPGLQRALLLREMDFPSDAMTEWNHALRGLSDRQLLAAADLALRQRWYDRAIVSASRTRHEHDFDLRFITPYRDLAFAYARENGLDEAWVFGLIRQESRFVAHARSRVGAQGLMQIMPTTAQWIARQLDMDRRAYRQMGVPATNIRFGTYYLRRVYESLERSPVLATAAYNAGPGRARRWQAEVPLEGAIYVETIPFEETRDYVKRVLANAMFYRHRFGGDGVPLKDRLGVIPPRPASDTVVSQLP